MALNILAAAILLACVACLYNRGLWTGAITLVNVVASALVASDLFEPVAGLLGSGNFADFTALWLLFALVMFVLRLATDWASRVRVAFVPIVDQIGAVVFSVVTGWVLICFAVMSLHVAPLPRTALGGAFMPSPDAKMLSVGPDRLWLAFIHRQSKTALFRGDEHVFDPYGDFVYRYAARRAKAEPKPTATDNRRR